MKSGQTAAGLEEQGAERVHGWQFGEPGTGVEAWMFVDDAGQHRIGGTQVRQRAVGLSTDLARLVLHQ